MTGARPVAWALVLSGALAVGWAGAHHPKRAAPPAASPSSGEPTQAAKASSRDSLERLVVARDVFRADRGAAAVLYDARRAANLTPVAPPPPKPTLRLLGVIEGDDPTAVVEGLPGIEGSRVMRVRDVVGGLTVRSIAGGEVRIVGLDTVWVLKVRTTW